jgi:glycosyltransferase involved in cell wall biosynthesis
VLHVNPPVLPAVLLSLPRGLLRGRRVIGYWTWELPVAPKAWQEGAPFVHEVWTVSRFAADALEPLLPGRVRVVPSPLAVRPPEPSGLGRGDFGLPETALVTLASFNLASSFVRKNPLGAIAAHRAAFGARADRVLLIKLINPHHFAADFEHIRAVAAELPNVRLETRTMPAADAHALTACCDIVLSLHRSEGYGLIPAEAMLLGRPVVATGWSGNMDYMDDECACLVPFRLVAARDPRGIYEVPGAVWAEPDIGAAAEHLRRLADDAALRAALGVRGRMAAQARLGPELLAEACQAMGLSVG